MYIKVKRHNWKVVADAFKWVKTVRQKPIFKLK